MNNLIFEHYKKFKSFDEIKFPDLLKLVHKSKDILLSKGWKLGHENANLDVIDAGDKYRFTTLQLQYPKLYKLKEKFNITLDIQAKTISKDAYHNGTYAFIEIPNEFLKKYITQFKHNTDTTILSKFLDEVDWDGDWLGLMDEYDKRYPQKHKTHKPDEFSWRSNFSVVWFLSIKNDGLITPLFKLDDTGYIFNRGSHRAWILGKLGYGFPIFFPRFNDKLTYKISLEMVSNGIKMASDLFLEIDYINRELNVYDDDKKILDNYKYD